MQITANMIDSKALADEIRKAAPPASGFSLWFLGQNSFVLKGPDGFVLTLDPYLSDWCATRGKSKEATSRSRLFPPPIAPEDLETNLVLLTHSHCDHADPETLGILAKDGRIRVAGPYDAVTVARNAGFDAGRITLLHAGESIRFGKEGSERTGTGVSVRPTFALPTDKSDLNHVGFLVSFPNGATFWDTGDTAWCDGLTELATAAVVSGLPAGTIGPDLMAVCINSGYGNLSHWEASRLVGAAKPRYAIPMHWDLFPHNSCDPFPFKNSLEKNAPGAVYFPMEKARRYDYADGTLKTVGAAS